MNLRLQRYSYESLCVERFQEGRRYSTPNNAKVWGIQSFLGTQRQARKQEWAPGRGLTSFMWEEWSCLAVSERTGTSSVSLGPR